MAGKDTAGHFDGITGFGVGDGLGQIFGRNGHRTAFILRQAVLNPTNTNTNQQKT